MPRIKLAVFDVDGVILDSHPGIVRAVNQVLTEFGGEPISDDWYQWNNFGGHHDFLLERGVPASHFKELNQRLDQLFHQEALQHKERPGLRSVLDFLKGRGIPIYAVSACDQNLTNMKLACHDDLLDYFHEVYGEERKARIFVKLMIERSLACHEILFLTDMSRDLDEAQSVGIHHSIALISDFSNRLEIKHYNKPTFENHRDVLRFLEHLPSMPGPVT